MALLFSASFLNADTRYRVQSSDSVKRIVAKEYPNSSLSQEQIMIEIFFRNPRAFIKNDINRLKRGYRLILPSEENIHAVSHSDAKKILKRGTKHYIIDQDPSTQKDGDQNSQNVVGAVVTDSASDLLSEFELSGKDLKILGAGQLEKDVEMFVEDGQELAESQDISQVEAPPQSSPRLSQRPPQEKRRSSRGVEKAVNKKELKASRKKLTKAKKQLKSIEQERQRLRAQLAKLKQEKQLSDTQLNDLDSKLQQSIKLSAQLKSDLDANLSASNNSQNEAVESIEPEGLIAEKTSDGNDVISQDKKKSILEKQAQEKTQKLKESNTLFQQKLQEARSELAENTRENIALERQLNALKNNTNKNVGSSQSTITTSSANSSTQLPTREVANSVAGDIGVAKYTDKSLDDSSISANQGMGKLLWLLPLLALFAGLWLLLRRFLGGKKAAVVNEANTFATPAFADNDGFDEAYEEVSLETSIKLDVARAYIEADDQQSAREMLQEVINEGNDEQQQEAKAILADYNLSV